MKPLYLKFENENEMIKVLLSNGFVQDEFTHELYCTDKYLDIIGTIPGKVTYDDKGNILTQEPDVPGWHVNLLVPDNFSLDPSSYSVINIKTPYRTWAGYGSRARV